MPRKKLFSWGVVLLIVVVGGIILGVPLKRAEVPIVQEPKSESLSAEGYKNEIVSDNIQQTDFVLPLDRADERVTKKPFGIYIDPAASPVSPERFRGYHTGTDFEVFPEEEGKEVWVRAICDGTIITRRTASGYGGVVVERCEIADEPMTVVYGHLALASVAKKVGDTLRRGDTIGRLGYGGSKETDGERMHLHLGIFRGEQVDVRGYVGTVSQLDQWLDPCRVVCRGRE